MLKHPPANAADASSIPCSGRSSGEGNSNPLLCSCWENPMDRGAWRATVHGVTKSWIWPSDSAHTHTHTQTAFHILFPGIKDRMRPRCHCLINDSQLLPNLLTFLTLSDSTFDGVTDKPILDCCACGTAKYRLTFYGNWSEKTHPKDYPRE